MATGSAPAPTPAVRESLRTRLRRKIFPLKQPEPGEVYLHQRRVYILPSGAGLTFGLMLILLFIGSVNYNLSLGFALTFVMAACGVVDMHLTFRNLAYLYLLPGRSNNVFAGEPAQFELHLINRRRYERFAIWLSFEEATLGPAQACDVAPDSRTALHLSLPSAQRGYLSAPRIRLQTGFPLGLLKAWSFWHPAMQILVYPRPETDPPPLPMHGVRHGSGQGSGGDDDFAGVRNYQAGDAMKHLAWRQMARLDPEQGGQLLSKHFEGGGEEALLLDLAQLPASLGLEAQLSRLTAWVLAAGHAGLPYAFRLPGCDFASARGEAHQQACLEALARYGMPPPSGTEAA
jgi:uncharacterized protein (DUF58 family)